jgi:predicted MFS family arabinose efflux permease
MSAPSNAAAATAGSIAIPLRERRPTRLADSPMEAIAAPAMASPANAEAEGLRPLLYIVGLGTFATTLGNPLILASLPLKFMLKESLGATPGQMALFFALAGVAWYAKPLVGLLVDRFLRRGGGVAEALAAGSLACVAGWGLLALVPRTYLYLLCAFVGLNLAVVVVSNALGGLLVTTGQRRSATGRMNSASLSMRHLGYLIVGPLGGYLAARPFGVACAFGGGLLALLAAASLVATRRPRWFDDAPATPAKPTRLRDLLACKPLWIASAMIFLVELAPGFDTPLFYLQTNELSFTPELIGWLQGAGSLAGMAIALAYATLCRRRSLLGLLRLAIVAHSAATLLYLFYDSPDSALLIAAFAGAAATLTALPVLDLAARSTPPAFACAGFALIMSARNIANALSDVAGAQLVDAWGVGFHSLVWINAGATALALAALPLIPESFGARRDGDAALDQASPSSSEK